MKISRLFTHVFLSAAVIGIAACTSGSSDETVESPFDDIDWPTTFMPEGVAADTVLLFGDGSDGTSIYPETYFDSGPTHITFTFEGDPDGGTVTIEGLPILQDDPPPTADEIRADENRRAVTSWTKPSSVGSVLSGFTFFVSLRPVDDDGAEIEDAHDRPYTFSNMAMRFDSVTTDGVAMIYRGKFVSGSFSMGVGPDYGDRNLIIDGKNGTVSYSLINNPFVFTTAVPVIEPEPEPDPDPDPAP